MSKIILLRIDDREAENLNLLLARYGGKAPAYFRYLLKRAYEKEFGSYKSGRVLKILDVPEKQLTDEQFCEKFGGKVGKNKDGIAVCIKGAWSIPLDRRNLVESRFKE